MESPLEVTRGIYVDGSNVQHLKALRLDVNGNLLVSGGAGGGATATGAPSGATGQVTVDTTATGVVIAAARATRRSITIVNLGTTDVWLSYGNVATTTGILLLGVKGAAITLSTVTAIKGIVASGSQAVAYAEDYD